MDKVIQEKRRFPRITSSIPVEYRDISRQIDSFVPTLSKDISEGGIRFICDDFISIFTRLLVNVALPIHPKPVKAISKIAWIKKLPYGSQFEAGVQFLDMADSDRNLLTSFLSEKALSKA